MCGCFSWSEKHIDFHMFVWAAIQNQWILDSQGWTPTCLWIMCELSRRTPLHRVSYPHQKATEIDTKSQGERFTVIHYCKDNCLTFCVSSHRPSVFRNRVFHDYSCCEQKHLKSLNSIKWCAYGRGGRDTREEDVLYGQEREQWSPWFFGSKHLSAR